MRYTMSWMEKERKWKRWKQAHVLYIGTYLTTVYMVYVSVSVVRCTLMLNFMRSERLCERKGVKKGVELRWVKFSEIRFRVEITKPPFTKAFHIKFSLFPPKWQRKKKCKKREREKKVSNSWFLRSAYLLSLCSLNFFLFFFWDDVSFPSAFFSFPLKKKNGEWRHTSSSLFLLHLYIKLDQF